MEANRFEEAERFGKQRPSISLNPKKSSKHSPKEDLGLFNVHQINGDSSKPVVVTFI